MPFTIRFAREEDAAEITEVQWEAFADSPYTRLIYGNGVSEDAKQKSLAKTVGEIKNPMQTADREVVHLVAQDEDTGRIIASAKWVLQHRERPESEWDVPFEPSHPGEGGNYDVANAIYRGMFEHRKLYIQGEACCFLSRLITSPRHQGKGAGSALLKWGLDVAETAGVKCYLESTPLAHKFYLKHGFRDLDVLEIDFSRFGKDEITRFPFMMKSPNVHSH